MSLFNFGDYKLSSGKKSNFKINCDKLTDEDLDAIAHKVAKAWGDEYIFKRIEYVPTGGERFAKALANYIKVSPESDYPVLLVDDVFTTGKSMAKAREKLIAQHEVVEGVVLFARDFRKISFYFSWIMPVFIMDIEDDVE